MKKSKLRLVQALDVVGVTKRDIEKSLTLGIDDFEDALQVVCARKVKADYIVTRNEKDFAGSNIQAISPERLIVIIKSDK